MKYRAEIDGLRAIAVLAVVIYHAELQIAGQTFLRGGFLGVDIFFVISGFLISKIIISELEESNRVDFWHFYERRIRRIIPALVVVSAATLLLGWRFLVPSDFIATAKSLLYALGFSSNFHFYNTATEYGAGPSLLKPLLHTWSLSVEEQFYLFFPVLALLAWRYAPRLGVPLFWLSAVASLLLAQWLVAKDQQFAFYLLPSRAWELLAGTGLAWLDLRGRKVQSDLINEMATLTGLALLAGSITLFNHSTPHPSMLTLIPVAGTCLIIHCGDRARFSGALLSSAPARGIGLVSYSLYLWHFPILAFARIANPDLSNAGKIVAMAVALGLSIVTYFLVERPFRHGARQLGSRRVAAFGAAACACLVAPAAAVVSTKGFPARIDIVYDKGARMQEEAYVKSFKYDTGAPNGENKAPVVLILGDSFVPNWSVALTQFIDTKRYRVISASYLGCNVTFGAAGITAQPTENQYKANCAAMLGHFNDRELLGRIQYILLTSFRPFEYKANPFRFGLIDLVRRHNPGAELVVFGNYLQMDRTKFPSCLNLMFQSRSDASVCRRMANYPPAAFDHTKSAMAAQYGPKYRYIDLIAGQCGTGEARATCGYQSKGVPFILDWNHLTVTFLIELLRDLLHKRPDELQPLSADIQSAVAR